MTMAQNRMLDASIGFVHTIHSSFFVGERSIPDKIRLQQKGQR